MVIFHSYVTRGYHLSWSYSHPWLIQGTSMSAWWPPSFWPDERAKNSPEDIPIMFHDIQWIYTLIMDEDLYILYLIIYIYNYIYIYYIYICIYIYIQPEWNSTSSGYMTWKTWTESLGSLEAPTTPSAFRESKASEFIWYNKLSSWMRHGRHGPKKNGRRNREFRTGEHLPISTSISDVYISTIWKAKLCPASFGELFSQLKFAGFHFRMGDLGAFWCIHFFGGTQSSQFWPGMALHKMKIKNHLVVSSQILNIPRNTGIVWDLFVGRVFHSLVLVIVWHSLKFYSLESPIQMTCLALCSLAYGNGQKLGTRRKMVNSAKDIEKS